MSLLLVAGPAAGHDFWVEPSDLSPAPGTTVRLGLRVGDTSPGQAIARRSSHLLRFEAVGPGLEAAVPGAAGMDPAGFLPITVPGYYAAGYVSSPQPHHLAAERFASYLAEEGLDAVAALRRERGETKDPARERFTRSAKTLIDARNDREQAGFDRTLGLPLELVPAADPAGVEASGTLPVRLLLHGRPAAGVLVSARPLDPDADRGEWFDARTDADGRIDIPIPSTGGWLLSAVAIQESPVPEADWDSIWASLTLQIGDPRTGPRE